jgi:phenylalanine-4-hydroxylase
MFTPMILEANQDLHSNHLSFQDIEYRQRRNEIVSLTKTYDDQKRNYPIIDYLPSEIETWRTVFNRLEKLYPSVSTKSYLDSFQLLKEKELFTCDDIPSLKKVSEFLEQRTGFRLYPISGLLSPKQFLQGLGSKIFYCTQYIRHPSTPFYTPEPDIIHEMLGHIPMFLDKDICEISEMIGKASYVCSENKIRELEKLYWFTIEFGLIRVDHTFRIYGAGILSSVEEIEKIQSNNVNIQPFDIQEIVSDEPLITNLQEKYYHIDSITNLKHEVKKYLINYLI